MTNYYKQKKKYEILNQKKKEEKLARMYHSEFVDKFLQAYGKKLSQDIENELNAKYGTK